LIVIGGIIGFSGIPLSTAISMIFTLGFVIAVDDTIHFLFRFKREMTSADSVDVAIANTLKTTGQPIIITSLILSIGYLSITYSDFLDTIYHGIFISLFMIIALVSDLLLLPSLIKLIYRKE